MPWHQFDFIFVITLFFAALDAWGIGANDVANSFATSVSSRSLTFRQAMLAAAICEFLGAVLVGARVTSTIKNGILDLKVFNSDAGLLMVTFMTVSMGSSIWLWAATMAAMPVSTTYSLIGAVIGAGLAVNGGGGVQWGWKGVGQIIASWVIAPCLGGGIGALIFLLIRFGLMRRKNSTVLALWLSPVVFFCTAAVLCTAIIVKGSPSLNLDEMSPRSTAAAILGTAAVIFALSILFFVPYAHAAVIKRDYTLRWYHFFLGPLLWRRKAPADAKEHSAIKDYYEGHREDRQPVHDESQPTDVEVVPQLKDQSASSERDLNDKGAPDSETSSNRQGATSTPPPKSALARIEAFLSDSSSDETHDENGRPYPPKYRSFVGSWIEPWNLWIVLRYNLLPWAWYTVSAGLRTDIHKAQLGGSAEEKAMLKDVHARAEIFNNETEHLFTFLQVLSACTASFAHGANDVSNAIAPLAVVYEIWNSQSFPGSRSAVPIWVLVFGGAWIVIGLGTYGWRLMSTLGNKLTLHSPSRGFCMEYSASIVVVLASYFKLPVSTTMTITGSTTGVALASGDWRSVNWRKLGFIWMSWVFTLPCSGFITFAILSIIIRSPRFGSDPGLP